MDDVELEKASASRIYDYFLGGAHNFPIDRQTAAEIEAIIPDVALSAKANRALLRRVVRYLMAQGIDQFLDIGSGIPTVGNVHEIAQVANPAARVVYVDIDPVAVHLSRALLQGNPGATVIQADARRPEVILTHPETRRLLDLDRPLAVLLLALLHFIPDDATALATVHALRDAVSPGSYLAIAHGTTEDLPPEVIERTTRVYAGSANAGKVRARAEVAALFSSLELVEPGLVFAPLWRPETADDLLLRRSSPCFAGTVDDPGRRGEKAVTGSPGEAAMNAVGESEAARVLAPRSIAARWYRAIGGTGVPGLDVTSLRERLDHLAIRTVALLGVSQSPERAARAIGVHLAEMRYVHPEAFGETLQALVEELTDGRPNGKADPSGSSLGAVVGGIAAAFVQRRQEMTLAEQHAVHEAQEGARRQAREELRVSEERYWAVVMHAVEGIVLTDARSGRILEASPSFQRLLGYTADELVGRPLLDIVAHDCDSVERNIRRVLREGHHDVAERRCRRKDGTLVTVEASITVIATHAGPILCSVVRDITERARAAAEAAEARRALGRAREAERLRLAQELHEGALQELAGACYQVTAARSQVTRDHPPDETRQALARTEERLGAAIDQLREVISELRPPGLEELGLGGALENYLAGLRCAGHALPPIDLDVAVAPETLPPGAPLCLFRIAQEALRNAIAHAAPSRIVVRLRSRQQAVILRVGDDGHGFLVPHPLGTLARQGHFGLAGMAERAAEMGGRLRVRSRAGKGTIVAVWLPLTFLLRRDEPPCSSARRSSAPRPPGGPVNNAG